MGAKTLVVPGNLPIGCVPAWLWQYRRDDPDDYDGNGCLLWLNRFSEYHNGRLAAQLSRLRGVYPNVTIAYADYFGAGMRMFSDQPRFGMCVRVRLIEPNRGLTGSIDRVGSRK